MNKRVINIVILSISFILVAVFGAKQYKDKLQYERYLSFSLTNDISSFAAATVTARNDLEEIIANEQITLEQADLLQSKFQNIFTEGERIIVLAEEWLKLKEQEGGVVVPYPVYMSVNFSNYIMRLEFFDSQSLALSGEQVEKLELMKAVLDEWAEAIESNMTGIRAPRKRATIVTTEYLDAYRDNMLKSHDWLEMLKQIQSSSKQFDRAVESSFMY